MTLPLFFAQKMTLWLCFVLTITNYDSISLFRVSAFRRHPKYWILIINSRDIPVLRPKNYNATTVFHKQWLSGSPLSPSMKNYDSYQLGWVAVFCRHPKCWILITNSRDILFLRSKKHGAGTIFCTKNDFVALLWARHEKLWPSACTEWQLFADTLNVEAGIQGNKKG